jgi:hypothetical protein
MNVELLLLLLPLCSVEDEVMIDLGSGIESED